MCDFIRLWYQCSIYDVYTNAFNSRYPLWQAFSFLCVSGFRLRSFCVNGRYKRKEHSLSVKVVIASSSSRSRYRDGATCCLRKILDDRGMSITHN